MRAGNAAQGKLFRRALEHVEEQFLTQQVSEAATGGTLLGLPVENREGLVGDEKAGHCLGHEDSEMIKL